LEANKNAPVSPLTIQAFKDGSERAFGQIFHDYSDRIFQFAQHFLHNRGDAEEICQEVFVKLWESRKAVDPAANFNAYLFTITRNLIFNRHKKKVHEWAYLEHLKNYLKENTDNTEQTVMLNELSEIVDKAIRAMPEKRRIVLELSRMQGLSHKEISEKLNISTKTIEVHISLALKELRIVLKDYYIVLILLAHIHSFPFE